MKMPRDRMRSLYVSRDGRTGLNIMMESGGIDIPFIIVTAGDLPPEEHQSGVIHLQESRQPVIPYKELISMIHSLGQKEHDVDTSVSNEDFRTRDPKKTGACSHDGRNRSCKGDGETSAEVPASHDLLIPWRNTLQGILHPVIPRRFQDYLVTEKNSGESKLSRYGSCFSGQTHEEAVV